MHPTPFEGFDAPQTPSPPLGFRSTRYKPNSRVYSTLHHHDQPPLLRLAMRTFPPSVEAAPRSYSSSLSPLSARFRPPATRRQLTSTTSRSCAGAASPWASPQKRAAVYSRLSERSQCVRRALARKLRATSLACAAVSPRSGGSSSLQPVLLVPAAALPSSCLNLLPRLLRVFMGQEWHSLALPPGEPPMPVGSRFVVAMDECT